MGAVFILRNPKAGRGEYMKWLHFDYKGGGSNENITTNVKQWLKIDKNSIPSKIWAVMTEFGLHIFCYSLHLFVQNNDNYFNSFYVTF